MTRELRLSELINPTPRQRQFLETIEQHPYTLYGGAAGGGKSYILEWFSVATVLKAFALHGVRDTKFGLFCEDYPALRDRHLSCWKIPTSLGEIGDSSKEGLRFKLRDELGGGMVLLRNLDNPGKYDSAEFIGVAVDEWTKNPWAVFDQLRKRLRWPMQAEVPHLPCGGRVVNARGEIVDCPNRAHRNVPAWNFPFAKGSNPGGIGHAETKRIYIDRSLPEHLKPIADLFAFVPAKSRDNPYNPPDYYDKNLATLPDKMRQAYAEGSWDSFEGQYFGNFDRDRRRIHTTQLAALRRPFWKNWISIDWGFKHYASVHWHTNGNVPPDLAQEVLGRKWENTRKCVFTYREHVVAGRGEEDLARDIVRLNGEDKIHAVFLSPDAWSKRGQGNTAETLISDILRPAKIPTATRADDDRVPGWRFMHSVIEGDTWFIADNCEEALDAIPALVHDEVRIEDVAKTNDISDDVADDLRYGLKSMMAPARQPKADVLNDKLLATTKEGAPELTPQQRYFAILEFEAKERRRGSGRSVKRR